jgi:O-antigen ligase
MSSFKALSPSSSRFQEIEFSLILGWALLYPAKIGHSYYLGFMCLLTVFTLAKVMTLKSVVFDRFSVFLLLFNSIFVFAAFFSPHPLPSLLFAADVFLVSFWCALFFLEKGDLERYLLLTAFAVSLSSLIVLAAFVLQSGRLPVTALFRNPILQGVASALAALVFLHRLLRRYRHADLALLALNAAAVVVSASKAAALGLAVFAAFMLVRGRRRWLLYLAGLLVLLAVFPNPLRRMVGQSLHHDPYVLNRLDIWSMSARMYRANPWTGVGPDLFAEAAPRFNFAQEKGPSRYGKLPESPHSDYWKIIAENGLPGLVFVLVFLFIAIRRFLSPPWPGMAQWLLAFLLAQMLLFNFVFQFFFLVVFLLLLRDLFQTGRSFVALRPGTRLLASSLALFMLAVLYLLPFLAGRSLDRAAIEKDPVRRLALLRRASRLSPLDERPLLARAALLRAFALARGDWNAWGGALENARRAQRLARNSREALILESELFHDARVKGNYYPAQAGEVLAPLRRAAELAPFDPFLLLRQAVVLREFGRKTEAREKVRAALALEPDFAAALAFIHELDGLPVDDPALTRRLAGLRQKAEALNARPGSYLYELLRVPEGVAK